MKSPTLAESVPCFDALSLNCVILDASPKPVRQLSTHASLRVLGDLGLDEQRGTIGIHPRGDVLGGGRPRAAHEFRRVLRDRDRMQVGDEEHRVVGFLQAHPVHERTEVVA